ncbi:MAG TPA: exopolysaccharide biosynthesis polyprenyl glycosylphosphotransferase [Pirellulales bacterium]|nr:exopolysaccharide biosynthesis polyprenyl glycosylphosphotransferase [Pirellulales bacterium]
MITAGFLFTERGLIRLAVEGWATPAYIARNIAIVGAGDSVKRLAAKLGASKDRSIVIHGCFDISSPRGARTECKIDEVIRFVRRRPVDEVIVAVPLASEELTTLIDNLRALPIDLRVSIDLLSDLLPIRSLVHVGDVPLLAIADRPVRHWQAVAKWIEDKLLGSLLLVAFFPLMAIIALLIKIDSRGPILFKQERFGFNDEVFYCFKFRTMYVDRGDVSGAQRTVRMDPRVTRIGRILRPLSLDELPQLINVLIGDMSLVGPRPHAVAMKVANQRYADALASYSRRHRVKPGITGWAQVHGHRGEVDTMNKARGRLEHDLYYIENWSIWLDIKTLALTLPVVWTLRNAY